MVFTVMKYLPCIVLLFFLTATNALYGTPFDEDNRIITIGIDIDNLFEARQSTVRVAASIINGSTSLTNNIRAISDFSTIAMPNYCVDNETSSNQNHLRLFQVACAYASSQCTNQTHGFHFNNHDPFALEENLTELFKHIKYTTLMNYGFPSCRLHAVIVGNRYSQVSKSLIEAAAKRAGLPDTQVVARTSTATMVCKEKKMDEDNYYLELHMNKDNLDITIVLDDDGTNIFDTLATERLNYTSGGSEVIPLLSLSVDRLIQNADIPDINMIDQVIITSSEPLTLFQTLAVQQLETFLKIYFNNDKLKFCDSSDDDYNELIPHEHRIAYGAARFSRSIAPEKLDDNQGCCCVELSPMHYGIAVAGGLMYPIIRMHSINDGPKSAVFTTIMPQRHQPIEIAVYRGVRLQMANNTYIGSLYFNNGKQTQGSLSKLNVTIEVNPYSDELILTVENQDTGQLNTSTFINNIQNVRLELSHFEENWDPQQSDLNRFLDQQLKEKVSLIISNYISTATNSLQERFLKRLRYFFLPALKKQQINGLLNKFESKLIPTEKELHSFTFK